MLPPVSRQWTSEVTSNLLRLSARRLVMSPDGRLASASGDGTIRLWDLATGTEIARFDSQGGAVNALAVLPDGRLALGLGDCTLQMWDLATGTQTARFRSGLILALAALPDGHLVSTSPDNRIRLLDTASGVEIACLELDFSSGRLMTLADGSLIACDNAGRVHWLEAITQ